MRVLVLDDDDDTRVLLGLGLERTGFAIVQAASADEARDLMGATPVDALVTDWHLGDHTALSLLEGAGPSRRILLTGDDRVLARIWPSHVRPLKKPVSLETIARALRDP